MPNVNSIMLKKYLFRLRKNKEILNDSTVSKKKKKKWIEVNDLFNEQCSVNNNVTFIRLMLISNLCN